MNDKIDVLFSDLKQFQEDQVVDSYYEGVVDEDSQNSSNLVSGKYLQKQNGLERSDSASSRDTLNSLYSNPVSAVQQKQTLAAARQARLDQQLQRDAEEHLYITPPSSSSNSMIILPSSSLPAASSPSPDRYNNSYTTSSASGTSRKRNGIININTLNLLEDVEEELYNLTPPRSPTRKISPIIIPPLVITFFRFFATR